MCCRYPTFFNWITDWKESDRTFICYCFNTCVHIFALVIFISVPNIISKNSKFPLKHYYYYHTYLYLYHNHVALCLTCQKETSLWSPKKSERFRGSSNFVALLFSIFQVFHTNQAIQAKLSNCICYSILPDEMLIYIRLVL